MTPELADKIRSHPSYNASLRHAAIRAWENRGAPEEGKYYSPPCFKVWFDGYAMYVRTAEAAPPNDGVLVCIAQYFGNGSVQLRYSGGYSEFVVFAPGGDNA